MRKSKTIRRPSKPIKQSESEEEEISKQSKQGKQGKQGKQNKPEPKEESERSEARSRPSESERKAKSERSETKEEPKKEPVKQGLRIINTGIQNAKKFSTGTVFRSGANIELNTNYFDLYAVRCSCGNVIARYQSQYERLIDEQQKEYRDQYNSIMNTILVNMVDPKYKILTPNSEIDYKAFDALFSKYNRKLLTNLDTDILRDKEKYKPFLMIKGTTLPNYSLRTYLEKKVRALTIRYLGDIGLNLESILNTLGLKRECCRNEMMTPSRYHFEFSRTGNPIDPRKILEENMKANTQDRVTSIEIIRSKSGVYRTVETNPLLDIVEARKIIEPKDGNEESFSKQIELQIAERKRKSRDNLVYVGAGMYVPKIVPEKGRILSRRTFIRGQGVFLAR
jgi:DNA-directed RNA polymerase subunit N (RpoN/RPB10)